MRRPYFFIFITLVSSTTGSSDDRRNAYRPLDVYKEIVEMCRSTESDADVEVCEFGTGDHVDVVTFGRVTLGQKIGSGTFGQVFETDNPEFVVKVSEVASLCSETAALVALNGLGEFAPLMHPIRNTGNPQCKNKILVMDRVGETDWIESKLTDIRIQYFRFAQLLKAVKLLHFTGFAHKDIRTCNIRVSDRDPSKIYLVDFGLTSPIDLPEKSSGPRLDLDNMAAFVPQDAIAGPAFDLYVTELSDDSIPNYDAWINVYEALSRDPTDENVPRLIASL